MSDWVKVEFWAHVPDAMQVTEVDHARTAESLARVFGFSRVTRLVLEQVNDDLAPTVRKLIEDRPSEGQAIWPSG